MLKQDIILVNNWMFCFLNIPFFFCKSLSASHYGIPLCSDRKIYFRHSALYLGTLDASAVELGDAKYQKPYNLINGDVTAF